MNKRIFTLGIAALTIFFLSLTLSSAYYYNNYYGDNYNSGYGRDYYDAYSYSSSRTSGSSWGPSSTKTTNYAKVTDYRALPYGGYEKTTAYVKTTTKSPEYYGYNNYGHNNYDYNPWYQKYWNNHDYYPRTYTYYW